MSQSDNYQLLIFDWDGTLQDSVGSIVACTQAAMEEVGEARPAAAAIRDSIGLGLREMFDRFAPGYTEEIYDGVKKAYRRLWFEDYRYRNQTFPGVREVLQELQEAGYILGVATAKSRQGLDQDLLSTGLGGFFAATRTADESRSKPDPQMVLDILDELGVEAENALVIGDTSHDLWMAHNAGADAAAVLTGSHDRDELSLASPLAYFEDLRELPPWLAEGAG